MKLLDTHGRKELIQFGLFIMGIVHIVVALCFLLEQANGDAHPSASLIENVIIILGLFLCRWMFSMTIGPITWLYIPEVVEPSVAGVATMLNWVAAASVSFIYPIIV
jgi:MFS family permease